MTAMKLNLGCGQNIKVGYINLDKNNLPSVDVVHDVEKLPLPFDNDQFDEIRCDNVLEHVEYIAVLKDLHRILKPTGRLRIRVPHFTSRNNYVDPTHKKRFSISTFEFFVENSPNDYYFDFHFTKVNYRKIKFLKKGVHWPNRLIEPLINLNDKTQVLYEVTFLSRFFPANDIVVELVK